MNWKKRLYLENLTIKARIGIFLSFLGLITLINVILLVLMSFALREDRVKVNLSQDITLAMQRSIFYLRNSLEGRATDLTDMQYQIDRVNESLDLLEKGGSYESRLWNRVDISPIAPELASQFYDMKRIWKEFDKRFDEITLNKLHIDSVFSYYEKQDNLFEPADIGLQLPEDDLFSLPPSSSQSTQGTATYKAKELQLFNLINPAIVVHINYITRHSSSLLRLSQGLANGHIEIQSYNYRNSLIRVAILIAFNLILLFAGYAVIVRIAVDPLKETRRILKQLSAGEPVNLNMSRNNDEIGKLHESLYSLAQSLEKITEFAAEVGNGNYATPFEVRSERDKLGFALLEMRDNLKRNAEEDYKRNWANEGLAKFSEVLRKHSNDVDKLTYKVIANLVRYISANQGGIFLIEDENNETVLKLRSAYAYNKQKYIENTLAWGQGLIGQALLERGTIYLTEVPQGYLQITSGLGDALPDTLLIVPLIVNEEVYGAIEIASFNRFASYQIEFVERISESIAMTLSATRSNSRTKGLLEESQIFAEQMRAQEEEMRQNMEELATTQEEMQRVHQELQSKNYKFRQVIDENQHFVLAADADFNIRVINQAYSRMFERIIKKPLEEGDNLLKNLLPEHVEEWKPYYERALAGEAYSIVRNIKDSSFEDIYYLIELNPLHNSENKVEGFSLFITEVTWLQPVRWDGYLDREPIV